jgi:Golgi phosphoprotein 3 (GPP34)
MAQIAEDLFLLLLDNASAQPGLDRARRERVLSGAVLMDLAYACRIRPAMAGESVEPGRLVALAGPGPMDPVVAPAFELLQRRPLRPATAVKRLSKHTEENLANYLEYTGQIRRVRLNSKLLSHPYAWPLTNRERVGHARSALLACVVRRQTARAADSGDHLVVACRRRAGCAAQSQRPRVAVGARQSR